uniref:Fucolectin tachylectin-4 pentraxin-1 domain-containing protein n=1 Tax=Pundamilia nyererei TaxID=303518 RepID=A0A3B4GX60_9CICH
MATHILSLQSPASHVGNVLLDSLPQPLNVSLHYGEGEQGGDRIPFGYPLPNVALKGEATQSSTLSFATASKAIDGRRNSFYSNGFCSHTAEDETNPWWRVDLQRSFTITAVKVTNRGDCCAERLDGAEIRIGNSLENNGNNNPRCAVISHIPSGQAFYFPCNSVKGRYVTVFLPGSAKVLSLCEVEVYYGKYLQFFT